MTLIKCPYCAEENQKEAVKCEHYKERLQGKVPDSIIESFNEKKLPSEFSWAMTINYLIIIFLAFVLVNSIFLYKAYESKKIRSEYFNSNARENPSVIGASEVKPGDLNTIEATIEDDRSNSDALISSTKKRRKIVKAPSQT